MSTPGAVRKAWVASHGGSRTSEASQALDEQLRVYTRPVYAPDGTKLGWATWVEEECAVLKLTEEVQGGKRY